MKKGHIMTKEHKEKIGLANKGKVRTSEWLKNSSEAHRGQKKSPTAHSFKKGYIPTEETRRKIGNALRGQKRTEEQRKRISDGGKGKRKGEKNGNWKGGITLNWNEYSAKRYKTIIDNKASRKRPEQCEVCGTFGKDLKKGLCFDHDHKTGRFRGWLCSRCNTALGLVKDNTETLAALIVYITNAKKFEDK